MYLNTQHASFNTNDITEKCLLIHSAVHFNHILKLHIKTYLSPAEVGQKRHAKVHLIKCFICMLKCTSFSLGYTLSTLLGVLFTCRLIVILKNHVRFKTLMPELHSLH